MARLDSELVRRGLARARGHAAELVAAGRVLVEGRVAQKPAQPVQDDTLVEIVPGPGTDYVGRGAHKLAGVLDELEADHPPGVRAEGLRCLDAGASTGGFTQVLLERGARQVLAVDVGHDQLASALREDPRVLDLSGTSVRGLTPSAIGGPVDLVVGDLSFISLTTVLADLQGLVRPAGQLLLLVKPQFEVGRHGGGSRGVVRDPELRRRSVVGVCAAAVGLGLGVRAVRASRWPGASGNVEYFVWLAVRGTSSADAAAEGPAGVESFPASGPSTGPSSGSAAGQPWDVGSLPSGRSDPAAGTIVPVDPRAGTVDLRMIDSAVRAAVEEGPG